MDGDFLIAAEMESPFSVNLHPLCTLEPPEAMCSWGRITYTQEEGAERVTGIAGVMTLLTLSF